MGISRFFNLRAKPVQLALYLGGFAISAYDAFQGVRGQGMGSHIQLGCGLAGLLCAGGLLAVAAEDQYRAWTKWVAPKTTLANSFSVQATARETEVTNLRALRHERLQEALGAAVLIGLATQFEPDSCMLISSAAAAFAVCKLGMVAINTIQIQRNKPKPSAVP